MNRLVARALPTVALDVALSGCAQLDGVLGRNRAPAGPAIASVDARTLVYPALPEVTPPAVRSATGLPSASTSACTIRWDVPGASGRGTTEGTTGAASMVSASKSKLMKEVLVMVAMVVVAVALRV